MAEINGCVATERLPLGTEADLEAQQCILVVNGKIAGNVQMFYGPSFVFFFVFFLQDIN